MDAWIEPLRRACADACVAVGSSVGADTVTFYVARWCQKAARRRRPDVGVLGADRVREIADRVARNLANDGDMVTRLVAGETGAWADLRGLVLASVRARGEPAAEDRADEALQRIAEVLLTGTPPALAAGRLAAGPEGPGNEFVFTSPFPHWARTVAINLVTDEHRRAVRDRTARPPVPVRRPPPIDVAILRDAREALPSLVAEIRGLPPVQRSVIVATLARRDLDEVVRERLHELDGELFADPGDDSIRSDRDIARRLGTTPRLVAANRSAARRKLSARDHRWALLLEYLLPHRSTARTSPPDAHASTEGG